MLVVLATRFYLVWITVSDGVVALRHLTDSDMAESKTFEVHVWKNVCWLFVESGFKSYVNLDAKYVKLSFLERKRKWNKFRSVKPSELFPHLLLFSRFFQWQCIIKLVENNIKLKTSFFFTCRLWWLRNLKKITSTCLF